MVCKEKLEFHRGFRMTGMEALPKDKIREVSQAKYGKTQICQWGSHHVPAGHCVTTDASCPGYTLRNHLRILHHQK